MMSRGWRERINWNNEVSTMRAENINKKPQKNWGQWYQDDFSPALHLYFIKPRSPHCSLESEAFLSMNDVPQLCELTARTETWRCFV